MVRVKHESRTFAADNPGAVHSVNLLRFIRPSSHKADSNSQWRKSPGAGQEPACGRSRWFIETGGSVR